jgi:hypothetical protein
MAAVNARFRSEGDKPGAIMARRKCPTFTMIRA